MSGWSVFSGAPVRRDYSITHSVLKGKLVNILVPIIVCIYWVLSAVSGCAGLEQSGLVWLGVVEPRESNNF